MANKNKKYTNKNLKAERSTTDTFYSKQKPIFKDSQSPYTASIFSNEGDTPELNWAIQHMEPFSSIRDAYGIYDAARRGDRADLNKSILSQIIPFVNYSDIDIPKEVKDAVNRTESENKDTILNRDKKAYGGTLDPSRGKEFTEDRTARGYYYYLGESNKSKLLDKLALAKSRLTPYAEGGFIEEEGDGPGTPKKSPAPKKAGIDKELLIRQQFAESSFNPKAKSKANARGLAQIMESVEQDAKKAGVLKKGEDIFDPKVNAKVQNWYINEKLYNSPILNKPNQKEDITKAKAFAAYNWGIGNVKDYLTKQKAAGVDIYNSFDWLKDLPAETKGYVDKILLKKNPQFEKQYNEAVKDYKYKAEGGWLETYAKGGPTKNVSPKVINDYQKYLKAKKAYDDSAQAYNTGKKVYQDIGKSLDERYGLEDSYEKYFTQNYDAGKLKYPVEGTRGKMYASKTNRPYTKKDLQREIDLYKAFEAISSDPAEKKMYNEHVSNMSNLLNLKVRPTATAMSTEVPSIMFFKKPVQPVEFRGGEEQPVQEQVSSSTSIEPTNKGLRVTKDARNTYYWSDGVPLTKDEYNRRLTANKATGGWLEEYAKGGDTKSKKAKKISKTNAIGELALPLTTEEKIDKYLGYPMDKAYKASENPEKWFNPQTKQWEEQDPIDNIRHAMAGRYTAEAIKNKFPDWMQYTGIPQMSGLLGSTALGVGHELSSNKYTQPEGYKEYSFLDALNEAGEDAFNNTVGAILGSTSLSAKEKTRLINEASSKNQLPDGIANSKGDLYFKAKGGELIKRADGSYSRRGLWDNIRANKGSGKKPTKEMLEQEAKIKAEYDKGGKVKPYQPTSQSDFDYRSRLYKDSLDLYNQGIKNYIEDKKKSKTAIDNYNPFGNLEDALFSAEEIIKNKSLSIDNLLKNGLPVDKIKPKQIITSKNIKLDPDEKKYVESRLKNKTFSKGDISPIKNIKFSSNLDQFNRNWFSDRGEGLENQWDMIQDVNLYKKPEQEILPYIPQKEIKKPNSGKTNKVKPQNQKSTTKTNNNLKSNNKKSEPVVTKIEEKQVNVETPTESAPFKPSKSTYTDNANTYYWYQKTPSTTIPVTKEEYNKLKNVPETKAKGGWLNNYK